ncbi:polysaccharide lyase 6 family protein [Ereboglobus luteus]|nr:polysaccharide lyase 6 family protein [Ereboglobus luteus]
MKLPRLPGLLSVGLCLLVTAGAATHRVANPAELASALSAAAPGDTIILADGEWRDTSLDLARGGTSDAPLRVRAQTPGGVTLTGKSHLAFSAPHIEVSGLRFLRATPPPKRNIVDFASHDCRLTDSAIVDCNPEIPGAGYYWIYFKGDRNRADHLLVSGKNHHQPVVGNNLGGSRHNTVDHCHFKDIARVPKNGREIFRIWGYGGNEELGPDGAFFTIESNLFEQAHGEAMEIISLKSNRNTVRNNTIRGTSGGITNRSGNYNVIEGNFIFGDGVRDAYGMRITGRHHRIVQNYIEGCATGIGLMSGELFLEALTEKFEPILRDKTVHGRVPRYNQPRYTVVAYNTLVDNAGFDIAVGRDYKSGWPKAQRVLLPESCQIVGNLIRKTGAGAKSPAIVITAPDRAPPLDTLAFAPCHYEGNLVDGGEAVSTNQIQAGVEPGARIEWRRGADDVLRPVLPELAANAPGARSLFIGTEGAFRVLTPADVGPSWK